MYRTKFVFILLVAYSIQPIITLPQGAPETVCHSLLPFHGGGIPPATTRPPYQIVPHNYAVNQGQILRIEIEPQIPELSFGGFMIHARNINPPYQVVSVKVTHCHVICIQIRNGIVSTISISTFILIFSINLFRNWCKMITNQIELLNWCGFFIVGRLADLHHQPIIKRN